MIQILARNVNQQVPITSLDEGEIELDLKETPSAKVIFGSPRQLQSKSIPKSEQLK